MNYRFNVIKFFSDKIIFPHFPPIKEIPPWYEEMGLPVHIMFYSCIAGLRYIMTDTD